jgi:serine protease Do
MRQQRTIILGGLLAAAVAIVVAGVAAADRQGDRRERGGRVERDQDRDGGPERRMLRLDGRGSQIGVMVRDTEGAASGVEIDAVEDGSAAAKAGVKRGDVVVDFDGERVRSARQLTRLVQETPSGRAVKMTLLRGNARQTVDITPESGTAMAWNFDFGPEMERDIERGVRRGLRNLPDLSGLPGPMFDFRFDGLPGMPGRGRLGVDVQPLSEQLADYFGVTGGGVLVSSVAKESPAEKAGVHAGDVITTVNGSVVRTGEELVQALNRRDDDTVTLGVTRDRKALSLKATIERARPNRPGRMARPA